VQSFSLTVEFFGPSDGPLANGSQLPVVGTAQTLELVDSDWTGSYPLAKTVPFQPLAGCSIGDVGFITLTWEKTVFTIAPKPTPLDVSSFAERVQALWRNQLVVHDSEWTPDVAQDLILPEEKDLLKPTDLGWWSSEALLLKAGSQTPTSLDALPKGLPKSLGDGKGIASIHPVSLKWLLELLHRSPEKTPVRFRDSWARDDLPKGESDQYARVATLPGYDKNRPIPCGGALSVLVLDNLHYGSGIQGNARLRLEPAAGLAPALNLEEPFSEYGIARQDFHIDVWGDWKLSLVDVVDGKESTQSPLTVSFLQPRLDADLLKTPTHQPQSQGKDVFRWAIPWKEGALGDHLCGVVELVTQIEGSKVSTGICVIPSVVQRREPDSTLETKRTAWTLGGDGFIVAKAPEATSTPHGKKKSAPTGKVTHTFTLKEWSEAANSNNFRLHQRLARAVQDLAKAGRFRLDSLDAGGLECTLATTSKTLAAQLEDTALQSGLFQDVALVAPDENAPVAGNYRLKLSLEGGASHHTLLEFDLAPALDCLVRNGLGSVGAATGFASQTAGATSNLLGNAGAVAGEIPGQGAIAKDAAKGKLLSAKAKNAPVLPYTVAFHLVPSHFLQLADRADDLIEPEEWAGLLKYPSYVGTAPGTAANATGLAQNEASVLESKAGVGSVHGSAPAAPIACLATGILGALGSQSFGSVHVRQIPPAKAGDPHQLVVSSDTSGTPSQWRPVDVRLVGTLGGKDVSFSGTKTPGRVSVQIPWPEKPDSETFDATLEGVSASKSDAPMPAALDVSIPLRPSWPDAKFVFKKMGKDLQIQVNLPGLKGAGATKTALGGAEKISVEVYAEGGSMFAVKGTHPRGGAGFTYGDSEFNLRVVVQAFVKSAPATIQATFDSDAGWRQRIVFDWDGSSIPSRDGIRFFDLGDFGDGADDVVLLDSVDTGGDQASAAQEDPDA
jgi:hypothetical protein